MLSSTPKWFGDLMEGLLTPASVVETESVSAAVKRVRLHGSFSRMTFRPGGASVVRIDSTESRNYTVAHHDAARGTLDLVAHLHGAGAGSRFFEALAPGDRLRISPPRGHQHYFPKAKDCFLFGDETGLALALSLQPYLKQSGHRFQFYFETDLPNAATPALLGLEHCTVFPKDGSFRKEAWIRKLPLLGDASFKGAATILSGNAKAVQAVRKALRAEGFTGKMVAKGYWLEGKTGL